MTAVQAAFFRSSLLNRMAGIAMLSAALIGVTIGLVGVAVVHKVESQYAGELLFRDLDRTTTAMDRAFGQVLQDLSILANTSPIQGLVRTLDSGGIDPVDGTSTAEAWKTRLAAIFASFHAIRPHYLQIRYIGFADDGREIVRVDKTSDGSRRIAEAALQAKGAEDYVKEAALLQPGKTYVTPVNWNRENGVIQEPRIAVARYIMPVFGEDGRRFGMIVINVEGGPFMSAAMRDYGIERQVVMIGPTGNRYLYSPEANAGLLELDEGRSLPDEVYEAIEQAEADDIVAVREQLIAGTIYDGITPGGGAIRVGVIEDAAVLSEGRRQVSGILTVLVVVMSLAAALLAYKLTAVALRPLCAMNKAIIDVGASDRAPELPEDREDEIGQISRSFGGLVRRMAEREKRARTVFDGVSDGIAIASPSGVIKDLNPAACDLFGYTRDELLGQNLSILMFSDDRRRHDRQIETYLETGRPTSLFRTVERIGRHRDGREIPVELTVSEIFDNGERYFAGILRDVSERREKDEERNCLIAALEASNEELDSFAYVASHDLKAPLRTIHNATNWIIDDLEGEMNEEMQKNIDLLRSRVQRMERLLDDLLEHSRIGRKIGDVSMRDVDGSQLRKTVEGLVHLPEGFTLTFEAGFDGIRVFEMPLAQVLVNLVSNAIKHHHREAGTVSVRATAVGERYRFDVRDDGPGIAPKYHEKIFQLFRTLKARDKVEGSGMGLAIVSKHVAVQGGKISVESEGDGTGATFSFTWPAAASGADAGESDRSVA